MKTKGLVVIVLCGLQVAKEKHRHTRRRNLETKICGELAKPFIKGSAS